MTDYAQKIVPPEYRNLVLNPSGAQTYGATWASSNGVIYPGSTATTPKYGAEHLEYVVADQSQSSYSVTPFGPGGRVHHNAFEISQSRTVSARVSVSAPTQVWVGLHARYLVWGDGKLSTIATKILVAAVQTPVSGWTDLEGFTSDVVRGATHWALDVVLYAADPSGGLATAPAIGTTLWVDGAFVPDSGVDLAGVPYLDGEQANAFWEGEPHFSTSRTGVPVDLPVDDTTPALEATAEDVESVEDFGDEADEVVDDGIVVVEPDPLPTLSEDDWRLRDVNRIVGRKAPGPGRLCLTSDVQLSDLFMNTLDQYGVIWVVTDVENWWTLPEAEVPEVERGWDDGAYETRGRYRARVVNLNGVMLPRSPDQVPAARNRLIQAANLCHRGNYFITHESDFSKGSKVWLSGAPQITTTTTAGKTEFSIGLRAPDPIKYHIKGAPPGWDYVEVISKSQRWPGRTYPREYSQAGYWKYPDAVFGPTESVAENHGNTFVKPIIEVYGPTSGPIIVINTGTQQQMRVNRRLYASEVLKIDCNNKVVSLNGAPNQRFYLDLDVDWIMLQPGANRFYMLEEDQTNPNTRVRVYWRSGWIG